jgi:hypothetical protein
VKKFVPIPAPGVLAVLAVAENQRRSTRSTIVQTKACHPLRSHPISISNQQNKASGLGSTFSSSKKDSIEVATYADAIWALSMWLREQVFLHYVRADGGSCLLGFFFLMGALFSELLGLGLWGANNFRALIGMICGQGEAGGSGLGERGGVEWSDALATHVSPLQGYLS